MDNDDLKNVLPEFTSKATELIFQLTNALKDIEYNSVLFFGFKPSQIYISCVREVASKYIKKIKGGEIKSKKELLEMLKEERILIQTKSNFTKKESSYLFALAFIKCFFKEKC